MPFINSKLSVKVSDEKKEAIKTKLGHAIEAIPGKTESWLMVGFEDDYCLYFKGNQDGPTAFIEVKIFGSAPDSAFDRLTERISSIYEEELGIPKNSIYFKTEEVLHWGWNGANF